MSECIADGLCDGFGDAFIMLPCVIMLPWLDIIACDEGFGDGVAIESARAMVPVMRASAAASASVRAFKITS